MTLPGQSATASRSATARRSPIARESVARRTHATDGGHELSSAAIAAFARDAKIGLLATVDADGRPHLTLITSIEARGPSALTFGQFTEGRSKTHVMQNPKTAFLVMTPERAIWRGNARWTQAVRSGADYERYNRKPMFRYNAYFGIHAVHYLDLVDVHEEGTLSAPWLAAETLALRLALPAPRAPELASPLSDWAMRHLARITTLKFPCWIGADGYPVIAPPVACLPVDRGRLAFRPLAAEQHVLEGCDAGETIAIFALNLEMESVLVRGHFRGRRRRRGVAAGVLDVEWVYNSMPPKQGQIYPPLPLAPVTVFD